MKPLLYLSVFSTLRPGGKFFRVENHQISQPLRPETSCG